MSKTSDPDADPTSSPADPLAELDRLIYFSEEPVDTAAAQRLLKVDSGEPPPTWCVGCDFPTLPLERNGEVRAWAAGIAELRHAGFVRTAAVVALPHVVYWFGWTDRRIPDSSSHLAKAMARLADRAERVGLPRPPMGISPVVADWTDVRRALTRATVGFRLALVEGRPSATAVEVERYLSEPRSAARPTATLINAVARGDVGATRVEARRVAESFAAAYISPLATLRYRLLAAALACGEAALSAGLTEHVVTRWADHRLRVLWQAYSLPLLGSLFATALEELAAAAAGAVEADLPRAVAGAKSLVAATWNENYPATYLAREVGVSVGQLSRLFKRAVGCSIPQYRNRLRVERAAEMLRATDKSVTAVALDCGFTNLTHFHRMFTRAHGKSPTAYRASLR